MARGVELIVILSFFIIGASHVMHPQVWVQFFRMLIRQGHAGAFINGFITLPLGLLIVGFHNVWTFPEVIITVIGWSYIIKGYIAFCIPALGLKSMNSILTKTTLKARAVGIFMMVFAVITFLFI
ncbi:MAG: hypothetical protein ICV79_21360 [Flavisolibacter sp.]|nr:hypothetical protein [Flavisolibacter sp.]